MDGREATTVSVISGIHIYIYERKDITSVPTLLHSLVLPRPSLSLLMLILLGDLLDPSVRMMLMVSCWGRDSLVLISC